MVGRPREFDVDAATDDAMQAFWSHGYEATSLQDLLECMHLSKSSFYQTFDSKQALFERCLERYRGLIVAELSSALEQSESAYDFIVAALSQVADETRGPLSRRGCLLMNTAAEFAQKDPAIAHCVARGTSGMRQVFERAVARAQREGAIPRGKDPAPLADFLVTTMSGLKTMVKAGATRRSILGVVEVALHAI